jgi:hypothetical protein
MASPHQNINIVSEDNYQAFMFIVKYDVLGRLKSHKHHDAHILDTVNCPASYIAIRVNWLNNELKFLQTNNCKLSQLRRNLTIRVCEEYLAKINRDIRYYYKASPAEIDIYINK